MRQPEGSHFRLQLAPTRHRFIRATQAKLAIEQTGMIQPWRTSINGRESSRWFVTCNYQHAGRCAQVDHVICAEYMVYGGYFSLRCSPEVVKLKASLSRGVRLLSSRRVTEFLRTPVGTNSHWAVRRRGFKRCLWDHLNLRYFAASGHKINSEGATFFLNGVTYS
jgi:hypothetical protein